jgi:hypothetical protein
MSNAMSGLPPKSPRQKKQKSVKPSTVVYRDLKERSRLSKSISKPIRVAIADAIIAFSEMEATADIVIWKLTGLSDVDGKLLTQIDAKQKLELAKKGIAPRSVELCEASAAVNDVKRPSRLSNCVTVCFLFVVSSKRGS